jgi:hypothetical protein
MAIFDEIPKSQIDRPDGGSPLDGDGSSMDVEAIRQRLPETRARCKELIALYLAARATRDAALARQRESAPARDEARLALSASVARYTTLLRAMGEPPERTLVSIKTAFSEAAPSQDEDHLAALEDIVKWTVEAYYAA